MFVGRSRELQILEDTYNKPGFQMTVIYGRRRIGKSTLINEFIRDKRSTYYMASQTSMSQNLEKWTSQFINDIAPTAKGASFDDLDSFMEFVGNQCNDDKLVLAIDEIPYLAESDRAFMSLFQRAIDNILSKKNIYIIICGSAISFMQKEVLSEKSPIFGRRTNQIFLKPFNYMESAEFVPSYTYEEKAIVYGITGGVARYLTLFDDSLSLDDNIIKNYFSIAGYLYEEPQNLLTQEFRTISSYNSVIEVCANGANKVNEIADKTGISSASLMYLLEGLLTLGIISKIQCMTEEKNKKKIKYEITDGMYRFWYKYIPAAKTAIELGYGEKYYYDNVKPVIHDYMGSVFEQMCRYDVLIRGFEGRLKCNITKVGTWWGQDANRVPVDIDIVGTDEITNSAVIGECKFRNEPVDKTVYEDIIARKGLINQGYAEKQILIYSLSGFTKWVKENADKDLVELIGLEEMYQADRA